MLPHRFSIMTFNVWGDCYWSEREAAVLDTLFTAAPDVLLLQEITPTIIRSLDAHLHGYERVHLRNEAEILASSTAKQEDSGWLMEGNIYWRRSVFLLDSFDRCGLQQSDHPLRSLFSVRLRSCWDPSILLLCATAHLPWCGFTEELVTPFANPRIPCMIRIIDRLSALASLTADADADADTLTTSAAKTSLAMNPSPIISLMTAKPVPSLGEANALPMVLQLPIVFGGDLNEDFHPQRLLQASGFLTDVFTSLDTCQPPTHPVRPSDARFVLTLWYAIITSNPLHSQ
jgi:hypothetical protein